MHRPKNVLMPSRKTIWLFLAPGILFFFIVEILPIFVAVFFSLFKWKGTKLTVFVGLDYYVQLLGDEKFWSAFGNNVYIVLMCILFQVGLGFLFAVLLTSKAVRMKKLHRFTVFMPVVLAAIVVGLIFSVIYKADGLLDTVLRALHLENLIQLWLDDPSQVMLYVTIPIIWQSIGYYAVIVMAGLSSISADYYEAAELDGASGLQQTWFITLPLIKSTIITCVVLAIAGNMKIFDEIYIMTKGGPNRASMVLSMYAYNTMFKFGNFGYGSAVSIGILVCSLALVGTFKLVTNLLARRRGEINE